MPDETARQGGMAFRVEKEVENHSERENAKKRGDRERKERGGREAQERTRKERTREERTAPEREKARVAPQIDLSNFKERLREGEKARVAAETNALELLGVAERELQSALQLGHPYLRTASNQLVYIADILENYRKLRALLDTLAGGELWPCILTHSKDTRPLSAPLEISPTLAAMLVAQIREASTGELPFPSAPALDAQLAVGGHQPYFLGPTQKLVGLPAENAEAGFVYGAKLDADIRAPFSPPAPLDQKEEPPRARVAVETRRPNLTVVFTHGYFDSSLEQFGISTPAVRSVAYGRYRFGIEVKGFHCFQESLVSVPEQLKVSLDLVPKD
jgi:hypothetical protein